jgi:tetracycline resistance efflux pump
MELSIYSLLPPLIVLALGYLTHNIWLSLIAGILSSAAIATHFSFVNTFTLAAVKIWDNLELNKLLVPSRFWESWNAFICIFLLVLGIIVTLLRHSGGAYAYGRMIKGHLKNKKSAESSSLMLSILLFMDDYFSSLTVGSVMRPITDLYKIPRAKLAFLVDSMAAPLAILCPFSSWVAAIIGFLRDNGVSSLSTPDTLILASPLATYLHMIPFIFYSFIIMASSFFIVRKRISFGLMGKHELIADTTGNLYGGRIDVKQPSYDPHEKNKDFASVLDFIIPILALLFSVISGLLYSGDAAIFCGTRSCIDAFQKSSAAIALFTGGIVALVFCTLFYLIRGKISFDEILPLYKEGILLMIPAIMILILAWTLGDLLRHNLMTGQYLASIMIGWVSKSMFPLIFFIISGLIAFSIGSSWGTAAIMFPIAIPLTISYLHLETPAMIDQIPILFPVLGAVLSGCVAGDHISPISDTTVMSATSSGSHHMDHVRTQFTYAIPLIISTSIAFLIAGVLNRYDLWVVYLVSISAGIIFSLLFLSILNRMSEKRY